MWYAIDDDHRVIAHGETFGKRDAAALIRSRWDMKPGTVAPYILTTIPPFDGELEKKENYLYGRR